MNSGTILKTVNLSYRVQDIQIIEQICLEVQEGEVLALIGQSGAGKSTFLRLLNRLDEPTAGEIYFDGADYRQIPPDQLRRRIGMLIQQPYLFPGTVAENIRFGPQQRGGNLEEEYINGLLDQVHLAGFADREVSRLSGGEAQRVSLARTLANQPEILLLDEPTSALDKNIQNQVETLICEIIHENHLTCLIVTHDNEQAKRMASRTVRLEKGRIKEIGKTEEVLHAQSVL